MGRKECKIKVKASQKSFFGKDFSHEGVGKEILLRRNSDVSGKISLGSNFFQEEAMFLKKALRYE